MSKRKRSEPIERAKVASEQSYGYIRYTLMLDGVAYDSGRTAEDLNRLYLQANIVNMLIHALDR